MEREIRVPRQKRSIEKKNKIIDAAYKLFNENGYNNTNTAEIAREAGIATGSVYAYFKDKKDIFLEALGRYSNNILEFIMSRFEEIPQDENLLEVMKKIINISIMCHDISRNFHNEIMALTYLDTDVYKYFKLMQEEIMNRLSDQLQKRKIKVTNEKEKMFLVVNIVDSLCHECIYPSNIHFDRNVAIDECANMVTKLLMT